MRIGHGYDAHRLAPGRDLVLGGVKIDWERGLDGHSDADVLIHAVCDALLGAAGEGDLGRHFPDDDPRYRGVDSRELLVQVARLLRENGWQAGNVDATVVAEQPRLSPHTGAMQANIAADLGIDARRVNVKATTSEGMGFTGRGEGIAAHAVVIIRRAQTPG